MAQLVQNGWRPLKSTSDLILWDPREFNTYADHAANVALDLQSDWEDLQQDALKEARARKANFRLSVDGARRGNSQSAAGIALIAYYPGGRRELVYRAGRCLGELSSAFLAEALAMEWGLQFFTIIMKS